MLIIEARLEDERMGNVGLTDEEIEAHDAEIAAAEAHGEEAKSKSIYAKIAKMSVSQKVQAALKGGKEERSMLIRDSSKVVTRAVLDRRSCRNRKWKSTRTPRNVSDEVLRMNLDDPQVHEELLDHAQPGQQSALPARCGHAATAALDHHRCPRRFDE